MKSYGSMDEMPGVDMTGGDDSGSSSSGPVTREEFEALKARVDDCEQKIGDDEQEDQGGDDAGSTSIAGAASSSKPTAATKSMVGMMGSMKRKPPFS